MTNNVGKSVGKHVVEIAQAGEGRQATPGAAIGTIAREIQSSYGALGQLMTYVQQHASSQDAQKVGRWIESAAPAITGLEDTVKTLLGVQGGRIVQGGLVAHAWMLDGAVRVTGDQGLYDDPQKVRALARSWRGLPGEFKKRVQANMPRGSQPIKSIGEYAALPAHKQEAYTRFDELVKCGGRGVKGHSHAHTTVPDLWVPGTPVEEGTKAAAYLNYALSSEAQGGIKVGKYSSETCAWDQLQDKTPPGALAMIAEKAVALGAGFGSIGLSRRAPDALRKPISSMVRSYDAIARAAAPSLYALKPVTTTARVKNL